MVPLLQQIRPLGAVRVRGLRPRHVVRKHYRHTSIDEVYLPDHTRLERNRHEARKR
jgi:hypothetical protein